ncbi:MAG TPA: UbiA family prenyltransferase [Lacipirellulaceae bacterium]|nr:UbiA family prenyltransferase [Lacipirellulaceae bacterium]
MNNRAFAWLQLLRLPNVFTAMADVVMGYVVTHYYVQSPLQFGLLIAASSLLYLSGTVLNDAFDADIDAREQPHRPIPSGRVSRTAALYAGWVLLTAGVLVAWCVSFMDNDWRPGAIGVLLAACIFLYDGGLKHTRLGPLVMGECRAFNVLLGMSLMIIPWGEAELLIAIGIGVYVVGVTMFARTDARASSRRRLTAGFVVLVGGMALLAAVPWFTDDRPHLSISPGGWYLLWGAIALIIGRRCLMAIFEPSPKRVQAAVRNCVRAIIVLDAAVCVGYASPYWGFIVLMLLLPTMLLTLWLNAT